MLRIDQIPDLPSHQWPGSFRVFPNHQLLPNSPLALLVHPNQFQSDDFTDFAGHLLRLGHRFLTIAADLVRLFETVPTVVETIP